MNSDNRRASPRDYAVMALVSCAVLLYEITITRILSVVLWYHFAFLAVSLAMLGLGAPGVWFHLRPPRERLLGPLLLAAGAGLPASVVVIARGLAPLGLGQDFPRTKVALTTVCTLVPLLLLGSAVCLLLLRAPGRRIARMYAADLLGAMTGAGLVVPLLSVIPTPELIGAVGFLPLLAAALAVPARRRWMPALLGVLLLLALVWRSPFALHHSKSYAEDQLLYEQWTPTARLTVFRGNIYNPDPRTAFGWGFGTEYGGTMVEQYWIEQDGSAGTPIIRPPADPSGLDFLFYDVTSIGYLLRPPSSVCIIGAGGGRDILAAVEAGATRVDAVELNPGMIAIVSEVFGDFSGDPYHLPGVQAIASEGRSLLVRTEKDAYDLIQISLTDSFAATTAGAYALSENYLYTVEFIQLCWERLTGTGLASVSRWSSGVESRLEAVRLTLLVDRALARLGVANPREHFVVMQGGVVATLLFSRTPFGAEDLERLDRIAAERGFVRLWPMTDAQRSLPAERTSWVARVLTHGTSTLEANGLYLEPPTDERPFFFQNVRAFTPVNPLLGSVLSFNDQAGRLPRFLIGAVGVLTLILFFSPFLLSTPLRRAGPFWRGSCYFVAIGLGFMLVEMPLIQRFVLYLGHPSYATTVVLSTLLLGSGLGSLAAGRTSPGRVSRLRLLLPGAASALNLALPAVLGSTLGATLALRIIVSAVLMVPLGFLLGFAFPTGMIRAGEENKAWFWALNGAASVLATTLSVTLASYVGLSGVVWAGVACYGLACVALPRIVPSS